MEVPPSKRLRDLREAETDWYASDDQHIPRLIKTGFSNMNQQQVRVQEANEKTRRAHLRRYVGEPR